MGKIDYVFMHLSEEDRDILSKLGYKDKEIMEIDLRADDGLFSFRVTEEEATKLVGREQVLALMGRANGHMTAAGERVSCTRNTR